MKKIVVIFLCLLLAGCVTMRYQDGNKSVEYASVVTAITEFLRAVQ